MHTPFFLFFYYFFFTIVYTCIGYSFFLEISSYVGIHSLIKYVHIVNAELIESTLKQTIMCPCLTQNCFNWRFLSHNLLTEESCIIHQTKENLFVFLFLELVLPISIYRKTYIRNSKCWLNNRYSVIRSIYFFSHFFCIKKRIDMCSEIVHCEDI
jgi:vacuolar-type H+-ATPase subunit I/STV1